LSAIHECTLILSLKSFFISDGLALVLPSLEPLFLAWLGFSLFVIKGRVWGLQDRQLEMERSRVEKLALENPFSPKVNSKKFTKQVSEYKKFVENLSKAPSLGVPYFFKPNFKDISSKPLSKSQQQAFNVIKSTLVDPSKQQLLFGCLSAGGCGKSHLLRFIQQRLEQYNHSYKTIAYTAVSASVCEGITCHSFLQISFQSGSFKAAASQGLPKGFREKVLGLKFLLLDEIGFINCDLLNLINVRLQKARKNSLPFGGVHCLVFGDLGQLPPFYPPELYSDKIDLDPFSAEGKNLFEKFKIVGLNENLRAHEDVEFCNILNQFRYRKVTQSTIDQLNARRLSVLPEEEKELFLDSLHIFPTRYLVNEHNFMKLCLIGNPILKLVPQVKKNIPPLPVEETLYFCEGAKVFLTRNLNFPYRLLNGSEGSIHSILGKVGDKVPSVVFVHFPSYSGPAPEIRDGKKLIPITPISDIIFHPTILRYVTVKTLPLKLAYGTTIHGVQSKTLERYVICFDKREYFFSQSYTALSRATKLKNIAVYDTYLTLNRFSNDYLLSQYGEFVRKLQKIGIEFETGSEEPPQKKSKTE